MEKKDGTVIVADLANLSEVFGSLCLNPNFSDITLIVERQRIPAHKIILSARGEYFVSLFSANSQQNEIAITDITIEAFEKLLKYIYAGAIILSEDVPSTLDLLAFADKHSFVHLKDQIIRNFKSVITLKNIGTVLKFANLNEFEELQNTCHYFIDCNALDILSDDCLNEFSQATVTKILKRDTFYVDEIDIFEGVCKWIQSNEDRGNLVLQCIRLSWMTSAHIVINVSPSNLFNVTKLFEVMGEIAGVTRRSWRPRFRLILDENVANDKYDAEVLTGMNTDCLLIGNRDPVRHATFRQIKGEVKQSKGGFIFKFGAPTNINHINLRFWDGDPRTYSYAIETSEDHMKWFKIIDYGSYPCRSVQEIYFSQQILRYIRITGKSTTNDALHLVYFEAYFKTTVPPTIHHVVRPVTNVATIEKYTQVIKGENSHYLLNGEIDFDLHRGFTSHKICGEGEQADPDSIVIQFAQPYSISTMRFLLFDKDERLYQYIIESSVDYKTWELVEDRRHMNCKSWQDLRFNERIVVFIKIQGTANTMNKEFHIVHFECPSQG